MECLDHPIGEPVLWEWRGRRTGRSYPNSPIRNKLPAFYLRRFLTILAIMGIAMAIMGIITFPLFILMPFMCLIMPAIMFLVISISFPLTMVMIQKWIKDLELNETVLTDSGIRVRSSYAVGNPTAIVEIPFDHVKGVKRTPRERWDELHARTPMWFRLVNGAPYPEPGSLFTFFSDPEDLVSIELKRPIEIDRLLPSKGFSAPVMKKYTIDLVTVDIDRSSMDEFIELVSKRSRGIEDG